MVCHWLEKVNPNQEMLRRSSYNILVEANIHAIEAYELYNIYWRMVRLTHIPHKARKNLAVKGSAKSHDSSIFLT